MSASIAELLTAAEKTWWNREVESNPTESLVGAVTVLNAATRVAREASIELRSIWPHDPLAAQLHTLNFLQATAAAARLDGPLRFATSTTHETVARQILATRDLWSTLITSPSGDQLRAGAYQTVKRIMALTATVLDDTAWTLGQAAAGTSAGPAREALQKQRDYCTAMSGHVLDIDVGLLDILVPEIRLPSPRQGGDIWDRYALWERDMATLVDSRTAHRTDLDACVHILRAICAPIASAFAQSTDLLAEEAPILAQAIRDTGQRAERTAHLWPEAIRSLPPHLGVALRAPYFLAAIDEHLAALPHRSREQRAGDLIALARVVESTTQGLEAVALRCAEGAGQVRRVRESRLEDLHVTLDDFFSARRRRDISPIGLVSESSADLAQMGVAAVSTASHARSLGQRTHAATAPRIPKGAGYTLAGTDYRAAYRTEYEEASHEISEEHAPHHTI